MYAPGLAAPLPDEALVDDWRGAEEAACEAVEPEARRLWLDWSFPINTINTNQQHVEAGTTDSDPTATAIGQLTLLTLAVNYSPQQAIRLCWCCSG